MALPDPDELVPFARWITPEEVKVRYDTWFYLALAPAHSSPEADGEEIVETAWLEPAEALARHGRGELLLVFPTIHKLQVLSKYETADEALDGRPRGQRRADPPAGGRQRRRAPHPAARRLGLLNGRQPIQREAVSELRLAGEAIGLNVALARVDHDLAALEGLGDAVLDEHAHARERRDLALVRPRQVSGEQERRRRVAAPVADHERQVVPALLRAPARSRPQPRPSAQP